MQEFNLITQRVIGAAIRVHKALGPGLLESAYRQCLAYELRESGLSIREEVPFPIVYKGVDLNHGYRIDILVEEIIVWN